MKDPEKEFRPIKLGDWLTGCMCWETKGGFLLILLGGLLLWCSPWRVPRVHWRLGTPILILGAVIQAAGLIRDLILIKNSKIPPGVVCRIKNKKRKTS